MSKTNIIWFGLRKVGEEMDNPSNFMYGDRPSYGLGIIHILGVWVVKRFAQLASPDSAKMPPPSQLSEPENPHLSNRVYRNPHEYVWAGVM